MAGIDYINALGAGASFDTKAIVEALVLAERAGAESQITRKVVNAESKISALGSAASILSVLRQGAELINDAKDFNTLSVQNSSTSAIKATVSNSARAGTNSVAVTSIAKEQRSVSGGFDSDIQALNGTGSTGIGITINGTTTNLAVEGATLDSIATAINGASLGVTAEIINTGSGSGGYRLQLVGTAGASSAFSVTSDFSGLAFETLQSSSNAALTVNGVDFTRASNQISDIIPGVTLNLVSTTTSTETISVLRDTTAAKENILAFIAVYNEATAEFKKLTKSDEDGALRGDTIFRSMVSQLRSTMISESSSPGTTIKSLSGMGISIDRYGQLTYDEAKIDSALSKNYDDVIGIFSANSNNQSRFSDAAGGVAGDIKTIIERITASDGYITTTEASLTARNLGYAEELKALDVRMEQVEERYNRQFLVMQQIIEEMNSTKDSLISSFDNLPFSNKNN
jgi:flagellar hook-associated protein 2